MSDLFLGVDGGGTKTAFTLIDADGAIIAQHIGGSSYHPQIGVDGLFDVLQDGVKQVGVAPERISFAFFGLPAFGEDSRVDPALAALPGKILGHARYQCGNDMICGWAGSLGGGDGINIVAGTGSIGYGERRGVSARAGGWGELFSDEGSAYWIAIEGLRLFAHMSEGREPEGPLLDAFRQHFDLENDLDICGRVNSAARSRDAIAALCKVVRSAAEAGDNAARGIFEQAGMQLANIVHIIGRKLRFGEGEKVRVSYSGGVFGTGSLILHPFETALHQRSPAYTLIEPIADPTLGAALYARAKAGKSAGIAA